MRKNLFLALLALLPLFSVAPAKCANFSLEKTEFMPLEQVNIQVSVSGWFRPVNVTVLLNGYPVAAQVYDASSSLYTSFLMPNGKPETLSLRVIALDCNQTHFVDSTVAIKRVESSEDISIKMLMENVTAARTRMEEIAASLNASLNAVITRLGTVTELERETHGMLADVNSSMIAEVSNAVFELSQELGALREALATLKTDTVDVKMLATGINDATHSGNVAIANVQSQVAEVQKNVYITLAVSAVAATAASAVAIAAITVSRRGRASRTATSIEATASMLENPQVEKRSDSDFDALTEYCQQHGLKHKTIGNQAEALLTKQQKTEPRREKSKLIRRIVSE